MAFIVSVKVKNASIQRRIQFTDTNELADLIERLQRRYRYELREEIKADLRRQRNAEHVATT